MAQPTRLETTMRTEFLPKLSDQVFSHSYLLEKFRALMKSQTGGTGFNKKLVIAKNPNTGTYEPYGTFQANPLDKVTYSTVPWAHYYQNIPISNIELLENRGQQDKTKITDILETEFENAENSLVDIFSNDLFSDGSDYAYPSGATTRISPIKGLGYWVSKTREAGGITSTATANLWWDAYVVDQISDSVTRTEMLTSTDANYVPTRFREMIGETTSGRETPDLIITTRIVWEVLAELADGRERFPKIKVGKGKYNEATKAYMGFTAIDFDGVPVIWDEFCPGGYVYFLNTNFWDVRALAGANMNMGPLEKVVGGDTRQATILMSWNIMCHKPQRQGLFKGFVTTR